MDTTTDSPSARHNDSQLLNRSLIRQIARLFLLFGLIVLAWQAISSGWAFASRRIDPALAVRVAPDNALALAALARQQIAEQPALAAGTARLALLRDPTNASAAGVLGMASAQEGDIRKSTALLTYSIAMSRRDLPTQLWALETAVQQGDIVKALHHYDTALRISATAPTRLFPILAGASSDPAIAEPLALLLRSDVPWKGSFLDYLSARTTDVGSASRLLGLIYQAGGTVPRGPLNILIQRGVEANLIDQAWALYARANTPERHQLVRNGDFQRAIDAPTAFDWRATDLGEARAEILAGRPSGEMRIEARNGSGGTVARQMLILTPGAYQLRFDARAAEGATFSDSVFDLVCYPDRRPITQARLSKPHDNRNMVGFAVPSQCPAQMLELTLVAGQSEGMVEGTIANVAIVRAGIRALQ